MLERIGWAVLLLTSVGAQAEGLTSFAHEGSWWQQLGFFCDTTAGVYYSAEAPGAEQVALREIDKRRAAEPVEHALRDLEVGREAGSLTFQYVADGGEFLISDSVAMTRRPGILRKPGGADTWESCRLPERTLLICVTSRRTVFVSAREGGLAYSSFDFSNPSLDEPSAFLTGQSVQPEPGQRGYRVSFEREGFRYQLSASADPAHPGASLKVLHGRQQVQEERCRLYAVDVGGLAARAER